MQMVIYRLRGFRSEIGLRRPLENRSDITMSLILGRINLRLIRGWIYSFFLRVNSCPFAVYRLVFGCGSAALCNLRILNLFLG
jgi:hypothetical protein